MFKNLLLVALRNLKKDKWYSLLNILGLTIGISFSLLLIFYIIDELSYDRYNQKADRIYRINAYVKEPDKDTMRWAITPFPMATALSKDYPEIEEATRFVPAGNGDIMYKHGETRLYENKVFYADSNLFKVFTHQFIEGNAATALQTPNSMVLTQSVAEKFFGKQASYIGKTLESATDDVYKITGVIKDVPKNSHLIFNILISRSSLPADFANNWGGFGFYTYVLLKPNTNAAAFEKKLLPVYDKYLAQIFAQFKIKMRFGILPVTAIHLHADTANEPEELGSMSYIYIFGAVAFFMLLIACINYMNLTTARSARRAKEIGIRKVTGSTQSQLIAQFLIESVFTACFALLLSIGIIVLLLPAFNTISGKSISFFTLIQPKTLLIMLGVVLFVGLLGGSYPAFYLSKFNPVNILKGSLSKASGNSALRKVLVVTQFSISMIMIICTWVVYGQLKYLRDKDLGFSKDQVMNLRVNGGPDMRSKITAFTNEMRNNPQVQSVSTAQAVPGQNINLQLFSIQTKNGFTEQGVNNYAVDENYIKTLGMKMLKGRNFTGLSDTLHSILVNEKMVQQYGWGNDAIGKRVKFAGDTSGYYLEVIGVVKDFNQQSLYNPIAPLMLFYQPASNGIQLKLNAKDITPAIKNIESAWKKAFPDIAFQYTFLDQDFDSQYAADQTRGKIFTAFSILTIIITCLGLLGLVAFTTQQKQKEIGIRKVMGAGVAQIIPLITKSFVLLVGISCFIAFPVAYFFMHKWLQIFPYNTGLSLLPFILSAIMVLIITMLTVSFHAIKAAVANPVESLRTE